MCLQSLRLNRLGVGTGWGRMSVGKLLCAQGREQKKCEMYKCCHGEIYFLSQLTHRTTLCAALQKACDAYVCLHCLNKSMGSHELCTTSAAQGQRVCGSSCRAAGLHAWHFLWTDTPAARYIFTCTVIAQYRRHACLAQLVKFELRSQNTHFIHASWLIFWCTRH